MDHNSGMTHQRRPLHHQQHHSSPGDGVETAPRLKPRRHRSSGGGSEGGGGAPLSNGNGDNGPNLLTLLFVATALATLFNLTRYPSATDARLRGGASIDEATLLRLQAQAQAQASMVPPPPPSNGYYYGATPQTGGYNPYYMQQPPPPIQTGSNQMGGMVAMTPQQLSEFLKANLNSQQQSPGDGSVMTPLQPEVNSYEATATATQQSDGSGSDSGSGFGSGSVGYTEQSMMEEAPVADPDPMMGSEMEGAPVADAAPVGEAPVPQVEALDLTSAYDPAIGGGIVPNPELSGYKDNWDPLESTDQPVFWHIPKAGGSTVKDIIGTCHRFTMASEYGIVEGHENDPEIAVVHPGGAPPDQDPSPFVNVDPTTPQGIAHAVELGLAESGLADTIVTPYIAESDVLFTPNARGRYFTVFRHPVDRVVSLFFYLQVADWEPTYNPELANMSLEEYARSPLIENNWMVRQLTSSFEGDLTDQHLEVAIDIVRRKFMVGLLHEKQRTMDRFEKFFGWKYKVNPENQEKCREELLTVGANTNNDNKPKKSKPKPGDTDYDLVAWQNTYDIALYEYIVQLFEEQEALVAHIPDGFRLMDASCAKCVPPTFPRTIEEHLAALADSPESATAAIAPPPASEKKAGTSSTTTSSVQAPPVSGGAPAGPVDAPRLLGYKDTTDPWEVTDSPVFWHIPKAGGSTVKDIIGTCHRFTQASEAGIVEGHENDAELAVVRPGGVPVDQDPSPFVNVDPTTLEGIAHAKELGLAESGLADLIVTPWIGESDVMFSENAKGRFFTVFRHPVDRVVSLFFYLQVADWEPTFNPDLANMSLEEYARSPLIENNWMVRQLTSAFEGDLTDEHLMLAKDIVGSKFMVGLLHEKERTMDRFEKFFRWKYKVNPKNQEKCREELLTSGANTNSDNKPKKSKPKPGDTDYDLVAWQNTYDIALYEYIVELFEEQEALVANVPDGFRLMDASCAKCWPPTFPDPSKLLLE